jgi:hypothetical protein
MARPYSFPIPVVGWSDDVDATVNACTITPRVHLGELLLDIAGLEVSDGVIKGLVMAGSAHWVVRLHCAKTYFQRSWTTSDSSLHIAVPLDQVAQKLQVTVRLVATTALKKYRPERPHEDFVGATFDVAIGDILALATEATLFVDPAYDPLKGEVSSILRIDVGEKDTGPAEVDFSDDRIVVRLPKLDWENFKLLRNNVPHVLHSAIVLPVLVEAVHLVREGDDVHKGLMWFQRLEAWMAAQKLSSEVGLVQSAQALLGGDPISRTCNEGRRLVGEDEK